MSQQPRMIFTSTLGSSIWSGEGWIPCPIDDRSGLATRLRQAAGPGVRALIIASDPADFEMNDAALRDKSESLRLSGIRTAGVSLLDDRNREQLPALLAESGLIFLSGGHVPTQNRFFAEIGLKEALADYQGTVVGTSAGSMNSAELVYAQPELPGEAVDPHYQRFLPGLGLTKISVLPHFRPDSWDTLDGLELWQDITLPDSFRHPLCCLSDGAYLVQEGREAERVTVVGPAWLCRRGELELLCGPEEEYAFRLERLI